MSNNPDEIRRDIERTRAQMSDNVNALADQANPKNVAQRQVAKVSDAAQSLKERVFGSDDNPYDNGAVGDAKDRVQDARYQVTSQVHDARDQVQAQVQDAPRQVKSRTRGNPIAAGLIAFGAGLLVAGLAPASDAEKRAAEKIKDQAQPLVDEAKAAGQQAVQNLKEPATQAVQDLKDHAQSSVQTVQSEAAQAKDDVTAQASDAKDAGQDTARNN